MPQGGLEALNGDPLNVYAYQYDLACNGYEVISGGIRNHKPEIMYKAFELAGYEFGRGDKRFGGMVKAFKYGPPPHGGCAAGIDRIVMLLADTQNIREVIMFPMNQRAEDLLMGAPSSPRTNSCANSLRVLPKEADVPGLGPRLPPLPRPRGRDGGEGGAGGFGGADRRCLPRRPAIRHRGGLCLAGGLPAGRARGAGPAAGAGPKAGRGAGDAGGDDPRRIRRRRDRIIRHHAGFAVLEQTGKISCIFTACRISSFT
jgi:hypothetical protein